MKKEVIAHKNPKSPISEVFRTLRTNIQFMDVNKKMKVLTVTSTFPGEGKSWVTSNLEVTFAQAGKKVVLIDADMRKGRQYAIFGLSPKPGLSNFLSQVEMDNNGRLSENVADYIQPTEVENLFVITAGNVPPNPSELLVSTQMIGLLDALRNSCDMIIIDGTPSELVTDSVILSRISDSTVIVTAHKITKKDALERVVKNIQNVGGKIAGVIINKVPISAKRYGEKYYYYGEDRILSGKSKKVANISKAQSTRGNFSFGNNQVDKNPNQDDMDEMESRDFLREDSEPLFIRKNEEIVNQNEEVSLDKTNDILKQINEYLDNEKKKL